MKLCDTTNESVDKLWKKLIDLAGDIPDDPMGGASLSDPAGRRQFDST